MKNGISYETIKNNTTLEQFSAAEEKEEAAE